MHIQTNTQYSGFGAWVTWFYIEYGLLNRVLWPKCLCPAKVQIEVPPFPPSPHHHCGEPSSGVACLAATLEQKSTEHCDYRDQLYSLVYS
jgi:hypothetical protein